MLPETLKGISGECAIIWQEQLQRDLIRLERLQTTVKVHVDSSGEVEFLPNESEDYKHRVKLLSECIEIIAMEERSKAPSESLPKLRWKAKSLFKHLQHESRNVDNCQNLYKRIQPFQAPYKDV